MRVPSFPISAKNDQEAARQKPLPNLLRENARQSSRRFRDGNLRSAQTQIVMATKHTVHSWTL